MKLKLFSVRGWLALALALPVACVSSFAAAGTLVGWNNLGMHCMDSDFSVMSILPPYNTIEAQLIVNGRLVTNGAGYTVTYEAIADPDGSINSTSISKGNFYTYTAALYGALAPDLGLAGWAMPGAINTPQAMLFETTNHPAAGVATRVNWFRAEGIPITPYDNALRKNAYPLMRLTARDSANRIVATNDVVLPISDEMDCKACHATGSGAAAQPFNGWVTDPNPEREYRLNILRLHDDSQFAVHATDYAAALAARGFNPAGLYANVVTNGRPVLCASCHASEALGAASFGSIPPLTASVHSKHANVIDPTLHISLNDSANRSACYRCHPGSTTKCLRGAMGSAVAADGSMEMQCQSCHGNMSQVGAANRVGWFMEPNCQSCHSGTATHNSGQIRYTSVFTDANGTVRVPVDQTFGTTPNTPAAGLSLYRFSTGHGGLQCSACHGSTHAEFPSAHRNDNLSSIELQGHAGVMAECSACHATVPNTVNGGPHGMHPMGQSWVSDHKDHISSACQACHGTDYRGTVLSRAQADRTLNAFGTQKFFRGAIIGCYTCHNGPGGNGTPPPAPTVSNVSASTPAGQPVSITLPATGTGLTLRIISQPANGSVGLNNNVATYFPNAGFAGVDTFTFAAYNGSKNSTLATGTITVGAVINPPPTSPAITLQPASQTVTAGSTVTFSVTATGTAPLSYQWQKNGVNIPGATSASLTLSSVTLADTGSYTVVVSNTAGVANSAVAMLTVNPVLISISLTSPPEGAVYVAPAVVPLAVSVTPTANIATVEFFAGSMSIGALSAPPFSMSVTLSIAGSYSFTARVTYASGASADSAPVTISVQAPPPLPAHQPPEVQIEYPSDNASFSAGANIALVTRAEAHDATIKNVQFFAGTRLLGKTTGASNRDLYRWVWQRVPAGQYDITAVATDNLGAATASVPIHITVRNRRSRD